jgi:hypothetical protein
VDRDEMIRILQAFEAEHLEYVPIGAAAMGIHGLVRATEDLDLLIRATPENIELLRRALRAGPVSETLLDMKPWRQKSRRSRGRGPRWRLPGRCTRRTPSGHWITTTPPRSASPFGLEDDQ